MNMSAKVGGEYPLQTRFWLKGIDESVPFSFDSRKITLSSGESRTLDLSYTSPEGVMVKKELTFNGSTYIMGSALDVTNKSKAELSGGATSVLTAAYYEEFARFHSGPVTFVEDKTSRLKSDEAAQIGRGGVNWLGLEDKFFLLAMMPGAESDVSWKQDFVTEESARTELAFTVALKPGESKSFAFDSYIGPKEYKILKEPAGRDRRGNRVWFLFLYGKAGSLCIEFLPEVYKKLRYRDNHLNGAY